MTLTRLEPTGARDKASTIMPRGMFLLSTYARRAEKTGDKRSDAAFVETES